MASPLLLLSLLLCSYCSCVALAAAAGHQGRKFVVVPTASFQSSEASRTPTSRATANAQSSRHAFMPRVHRHGPCATVPSEEEEPFKETLRRDLARTKYITRSASRSRRLQNTGAAVSVPAQLGSSVDTQLYVVTVGLGTPAVPQTLALNTGSSLTWIQCKPCNAKCYPQRHPLFDPSSSSTFAPVPCDSQACSSLASGTDGNGCNSDRECAFQLAYLDGSNTTGAYSTDALTLGPGAVVKSFHFGCGHDQEGSTYDKYDGILGLGRRPESLALQTSTEHRGVFSHCLPPTGSATGFLALGAPDNTSGFAFTPLLTIDEQPELYQLMLTGIIVGGRKLDIQPAAFSEGLIVVTGSVTTALQDTAYAALRTAFRRAMRRYPLAAPVSFLDTCYNFTGFDHVVVPTVSLEFRGGATVDLDAASGVMLNGCLAFSGTGADNYAFLGNVNQRTIEVLYDMPGGRVGFRPGAC